VSILSKKCGEPQKMNLGFLGGGTEGRVVDVGPEPVALWKPVSAAILAYVTVIFLAAFTGNLQLVAGACLSVGVISFFAAKLWLFALIARGSVFAAMCCVCVPFLWVFFVSEHWIIARWPVCLGVMGVASVPISV